MSTSAEIAPPSTDAPESIAVSPTVSPLPQEETTVTFADPSPTMPSEPEPVPEEANPAATYTYALSLLDLAGLSPDAAAGTELEIWVAWEPPVTKQPKIQRLVDGVRLDRIVPPVTPDGSPVAILRMDRRSIGKLIWGDRYGSLSAVVVSS